MRAPISVIIPTLNAANELPACLMALGEGLDAGLVRELIITDGGSSDGTLKIADAAGAEIVNGAASRGGQLRRGADAAQGQWLLFLHADTLLAPGWADVVLAHLTTTNAGYFKLGFDSAHPMARFVSGWANLRSRLFALPYGDQGLLAPRALYDDIGGFPDQPLMEDVAIARALKGRLVCLNAKAITSATRYERDGWLRRGARNLVALCRYLAGTSPEKLARAYRSTK